MSTLITPGVNARWSTAPPEVGDITAIDTTFLPVVSERGPIDTPVELASIDAYRPVYGERSAVHAMSYDSVEALTRGSGGRRVVAVRVVGPDAAVATVTLDGPTLPSVQLDAGNPGTWGNDLEAAVVAGSSGSLRTLVVTESDVEVLRVVDFADAADLVDQLEDSDLLDATLLGEPDDVPAIAAAAALTGGLDDDDGITLTEVAAALDLIGTEWGPGQLLAPLWTSTAAHQMLLEQAAKDWRNRVAYLDAPLVTTYDDTADTTWAAMRAAVEDYTVDGVDVSRLGLPFPVWHNLQPYGRGDGIARRVPGSVFAAAVTAHADQTNGPNTMPIAERGYPADKGGNSVFGRPVLTISPAQRTVLSADHINVPAYDRQLGVRLYGFRTVSADPQWRQGNWARYAMSLQARVDARGESYVGGPVTSQTLAAMANDAALELTADWEADQIYGATPDEAYTVDAGPTVNPPTSIAEGFMLTRIEAVMTAAGETVIFDLIKRPIA